MNDLSFFKALGRAAARAVARELAAAFSLAVLGPETYLALLLAAAAPDGRELVARVAADA